MWIVDGVPDLSGKSVSPVDQIPAGHDAAADAGPKGNDDEILHSLCCAIEHLTQRGGIRVVGHGNRNVVILLEQRSEVRHRPPFQVGGTLHRPAIVVGVRSTDANPFHDVPSGERAVQFIDSFMQTADQPLCRVAALGRNGGFRNARAGLQNKPEDGICPSNINAEGDILRSHVSCLLIRGNMPLEAVVRDVQVAQHGEEESVMNADRVGKETLDHGKNSSADDCHAKNTRGVARVFAETINGQREDRRKHD